MMTTSVLLLNGSYEPLRIVSPRKAIGLLMRGVAEGMDGIVLTRDRYTCVYCGARVGDWRHGRVLARADFSVDHLIPRSQGGGNAWGNTACACRWCNHRKADRAPHEAGMRLRWEPKPRFRTPLAAKSGQSS
ncbi:MAG: HNH endonuclease [Anaerolineae bacterium]